MNRTTLQKKTSSTSSFTGVLVVDGFLKKNDYIILNSKY